jgi:DNA gyrase subunit B
MDNEKGEIPVEVALIYNTSYSENIFSPNNINTHEGGNAFTRF